MNCPCSRDCCDKPEITSHEHGCEEERNGLCEKCYGLTCLNCGKTCFCEL